METASDKASVSKRMRITKPNVTETELNATAVAAHLRDDKIIQWTEENVLLLCVGMVRQYTKYAIVDIGNILFKYTKHMLLDYHISNNRYSNIFYFSDNCLLCNFKSCNSNNTDLNRTHSCSTIIFTPYISQLFKSSLLEINNSFNNSHQSNSHLNSSNVYGNTTRTTVVRLSMRLVVNKADCNVFDKSEHAWACGVIAVPKSKDGSVLVGLNELKDIFENKMEFKHDSMNLSMLCDYNWPFNTFKTYFIAADSQILTQRGDLIANNNDNNDYNDNNKFMFPFSLGIDGDVLARAYNSGEIIELKFDEKMDIFKDYVSVCVECVVRHNSDGNEYSYDYYLSFVCKDVIIDESFGFIIGKNILVDGKIKLDFDKYDYLFAMDCLRCDCAGTNGIEFKVSIE